MEPSSSRARNVVFLNYWHHSYKCVLLISALLLLRAMHLMTPSLLLHLEANIGAGERSGSEGKAQMEKVFKWEKLNLSGGILQAP